MGDALSGYARQGIPHTKPSRSTLHKEKNPLYLSTADPMTGGYRPWSKFNAHQWSNLNARGHAKAIDNAGGESFSAATLITVDSGAAKLYYLHTDHLETPRLVTDESNTIVWRNSPLNEPFGNAPPEEDPDGDGVPFTLNLRFPGQYFDKETNTNYNYFRDYNPETDRYLQFDPIGLRGGINGYTYVKGNPLGLSDPLGLAYFAKRNLSGLPWLPFARNPLDDFFNTELAHEQLFFEDGKSPSNIGFFDDGNLRSDPNPGYRISSGKFDDCIMRKAVSNVGPLPSYSIYGSNCQDWAERVRAEYARLAKDPQTQKECGCGK